MVFLILLDAAPRYHTMMVGMGEALRDNGHKVCYAIDTPLNNFRFREHPATGDCRIFSEFLADYPRIDVCDAEDVGDWEAFIADFDRYQNFGVNDKAGMGWYSTVAMALYDFFCNCIQDMGIDVVFYEGVTNSFAYYANKAARKHGAVYVGLQASRLPCRHEFHGSRDHIFRQRVEQDFNALVDGSFVISADDTIWLDAYLQSFEDILPDYMKTNGQNLENPFSKYLKKSHLKTLWRLTMYTLVHRGERWYSYRSGPPLLYSFKQILRNVRRWVRAKTITHFFGVPDQEESYYLYPLQFHPEASTSVNARWYVDEYPVIKNLAMSLPFGRWLYVKDHPSAIGFPSREFYRLVSNIPNVKLLPSELPTKTLIRNSIGVVTLTSTVGYEALVLQKPVWVLGDVFYEFHPGCRKIRWGEDLLRAWNDHNPELSRQSALHVVQAYYANTMPGALPLGGESDASASFYQLAEEVVEYVEQLMSGDKEW